MSLFTEMAFPFFSEEGGVEHPYDSPPCGMPKTAAYTETQDEPNPPTSSMNYKGAKNREKREIADALSQKVA